MSRVNWLAAWDDFRETIRASKKSVWSKAEIFETLDKIERKVVREAEDTDEQNGGTPDAGFPPFTGKWFQDMFKPPKSPSGSVIEIPSPPKPPDEPDAA